jgi:hypothetical protein
VNYEEELKHKAVEITRAVAGKEEEIINVKRKFLEEKKTLELEKKKL